MLPLKRCALSRNIHFACSQDLYLSFFKELDLCGKIKVLKVLELKICGKIQVLKFFKGLEICQNLLRIDFFLVFCKGERNAAEVRLL